MRLDDRSASRRVLVSLAFAALLPLPLLAEVTLFGPTVYTATAGKPVTVTGSFSATGPCDVSPAAVYTLTVVNGNADGSARVSSATISLNGVEVVSQNDFNQKVPSLVRVVQLQQTNTLAITIDGGKSDARITLTVGRHIDLTTAVFGPKRYTSSGGNDAFHDTFTVGDATASYTLTVRNGDGTAAQVKNASVALNGVEVVSKSDLASNATVTKPVALKVANDLLVNVNGTAGNLLSVVINEHLVDMAGPVVTLAGVTDGEVVGATPLTIAGNVTDDSGVASLSINGTAVPVAAGGGFSTAVALVPGANTIPIDATDCEGNQSHRSLTVTLSTAPTVTINLIGATKPGTITISGTVVAANGLASLDVNGSAPTVSGTTWSVPLTFGVEGLQTVTATATDRAGKNTTAKMVFYTDATPPTIAAKLLTPANANGWISGFATVHFDCADAVSGVAFCTPDVVITTEGPAQVITGNARDLAGNSASTSINVNVDLTPPQVSVSLPVSSTPLPTVRTPSLTLTGNASDSPAGIASLTCNGVAAALAGSTYTCTVAITDGPNLIDVVATDRAGATSHATANVVLDRQPPTVAFGAPDHSGLVVNTAAFTVVGYASDASGISAVSVNGQPVTLTNGRFTTTINLSEGANPITANATDNVGNTANVATSVTLVTPVHVTITSPADLLVTNAATVAVSGTVTPANSTVVVNGINASVVNGVFAAAAVPLWQGRTIITALATSPVNTVATSSINVYRDSIPPRVTVYYPANDGDKVSETPLTVEGMVDDVVVGTINGGQVTVTVNGTAAQVSNRAFLATGVTLAAGTNTLTVVATDQGGNRTTVTRQVVLDTLSSQAHIVRVSGNDQQAVIGAQLAQPIVVKLVDAAGRAVSGQPVVFSIIENNGALTGGSTTGRQVTVTTDSKGNASATWRLGMRAGAGNNRAVANAAGYAGSIEFEAIATPGTPARIVVDANNSQFGIVKDRLARPFIAVVVDAGSNRIANVPVTFTIVKGGGNIGGSTSAVVNTDSDGRAWVVPVLGPDAGNDNNVVQASISPSIAPAVFIASGRLPRPASQTQVSGVVLDNTDLPIAGVSVRIDGTTLSTQTNAQGQFVIKPAPVGYVKLFIDGSTAQRPGTWPTLEYVMYTNPGNDNTVGMPIHILPIDVQRGLQVDEKTGGTLTLAEMPGFSLTVAPGSALFPSGSRAGTVSATLVHADKMPMTPAFGQQPRFLLTIQPTGVHFDPPAAITFPNIDGLAPGEITELYSFDHDLGQFVAIGTGSVTDDGSVLKSDRGVGIIKGGWHGGGSPVPAGAASALSVSVSVPATTQDITTPIDVVATATPSGGSFVNWEVVDDPADPTDDPSIASFSTSPACTGAATCTAELMATSGGTVTVRVSYQPTSGSTVTSELKKVHIAALKVSALLSLGSYTITKDRQYPNVSLPIPAVVWVRTLGNIVQDPMAYTRTIPGGTDRKLKVQVQFDVSGVVTSPLTGITIYGDAGSFHFKQENVSVPIGATHTDWLTVESDEALPQTTKYYNPLEIKWSYTLGSDPTQVAAGSTKNELFVTLNAPVLLGSRPLFYSTLKLAVQHDGATDLTSALENTWSAFAGPANIQTWDLRALQYYAPGYGFKSGGVVSCALDEGQLLAHVHESGQCGSFADLLRAALAINGVPTHWTDVGSKDGTFMVVKAWSYGSPRYPNGAPAVAAGGFKVPADVKEYMWRFEFNPVAVLNKDIMVPAMPNNVYGDLTSLVDLPGQNTRPPSEKIFGSHFIVTPYFTPAIPSPPFFDPSYGVRYVDQDDFEVTAIEGYMAQLMVQPDPTAAPHTEVLFRKATNSDGTQHKNIVFVVK